MFRQFLNWRTILAIIAILIVSGTIFYSQYLARKIAKEERSKVEQWVDASKFLINAPNDADITFASKIMTGNKTIPIIVTNEKDSIVDYVNLDTAQVREKPTYLVTRLKNFKASGRKPVIYIDPNDSTLQNKFYYGHTSLLSEVKYYPLIQLCIVALFIVIILMTLRSNYRSVQNQVWAGMAKETAHQLGTPVSSLEGWVEMLKDSSNDKKIVVELEKDVDRLRLVSDRFGKIGSTPQLEEVNLVSQINYMVEYMKRRATGRINFIVNNIHPEIITSVSPPLFDWVIENLLKNALDAMEGKGIITISIHDEQKKIIIDVTDTGKGIGKQNMAMVFKPGFTTKKRGWGLGLSLSRRIISMYHKGEIFVKHSEPGKGTTFRIVLKK